MHEGELPLARNFLAIVLSTFTNSFVFRNCEEVAKLGVLEIELFSLSRFLVNHSESQVDL